MLRLENEQIHWELRRHFASNLERLIKFVPGRHDNEKVHIAVGVWCAVRIGTEQDDFIGVESLGDLAREPANHVHGNVRSAIPAGWRGIRHVVAFIGHRVIVPRRASAT
jgi:hypothetical protein